MTVGEYVRAYENRRKFIRGADANVITSSTPATLGRTPFSLSAALYQQAER